MHRARGQICALVQNMQNMPAMDDGHDATQNMQNNFLSTHCWLVTDWSGGKRRQAVDRFHFDYVRPLGCQFVLNIMCVFYIFIEFKLLSRYWHICCMIIFGRDWNICRNVYFVRTLGAADRKIWFASVYISRFNPEITFKWCFSQVILQIFVYQVGIFIKT